MNSARYSLDSLGRASPARARAGMRWPGWGARVTCATLFSLASFARLLQREEGGRDSDRPAGRTARPSGQARGAEGDPFEALVTAHEGELFAYLWRMTGDEAAAYDLRQETFIRAWRAFDRLRAYERPVAWLYRVATNLALNHRRDQRGHIPLAAIPFDPAASDPSGRLVERDLVRATLLALPSRERAALALREGQGLSCDAVAAALGVSPPAARTLLWRARERFRDFYLRADPGAAARWGIAHGGNNEDQGGAR